MQRPADTGNTIDGAITEPPPKRSAERRRKRWAVRPSARTRRRWRSDSGQGPMIERVWVNLTSQGGDISLPDGDHVWSYLLYGTGQNGAWRINDQGTG